ncbi:MAG TPA: hypothetical protein VIH57_00780 [Bacteroidales bacterium]|jgi:hypothetical protein
MDTVILVGPKHWLIAKKTIYYLKLYLKNDKIYLITKSSLFYHFSDKFCTEFNVVLLDEDTLLEDLTYKKVNDLLKVRFVSDYNAGWYFQQFLKLGFATTPYANNKYLVWDADTMPTNEITLYDDTHIYFTAKEEYHEPYFETIYRILGLKKNNDFSFIAEHMVFDTQILKKMIDDIKNSQIEGKVWYEKIINAIDPSQPNGFSEFETYGTYVSKYYNGKYKIQYLKTYRHAGLRYDRLLSKRDVTTLSKMGYHTISLEESDCPPFPRSVIWGILFVYIRISNLVARFFYR